jgi:hypothetical protein
VLSVGFIAAGVQPAAGAGFGARWQMNEKTGPARDSSANDNDGTIHGGVARTGKGYVFDGRSGYVRVPNSPSLNPGGASFSITLKFSLDGKPAKGDDYDLLRKGLAGTAGGDFKVEVMSDGSALCRFRGSHAAVVVRGGSGLGTGTHVVRCQKTSGAVSVYVDGSKKRTTSKKVGAISNNQPVILGAKPGDDFTDGRVDYIIMS